VSKLKTVFVCSECGYRSLKWLGRCPECQSWDSLAEEALPTAGRGASAGAKAPELIDCPAVRAVR
jgi:DNA repair protein RadA/Sms